MPRPLVYGNGQFLIAFDRRHRARDLFWPSVGHPNDLLGNAMRVGVWCDGQFSWCDSADWDIKQTYQATSLIGSSLWRSWKMGLEIDVNEACHPVAPVFSRRFTVRDLRGLPRSVRFFFTQNFVVGQSDVGNTALYDPFHDTIVHYRGRTAIAMTVDDGVKQYATGITGFADLKGTWMDAEDGVLSGNPIAQGSVDSTFGSEVSLTPQGEAPVRFRMAFGHTMAEANHRLKAVESHDQIVRLSQQDSSTWLERSALDLSTFPSSVQDLFWRSLLIIRTQVDREGAILAANDSDILETNRATYSYCWPRDGALVSMVMAKAGYPEVLENFLDFCGRVIDLEQPVFLQKYRSDGALGASWHPWIVDGQPCLPFQEDETALTLLALTQCPEPKRTQYWDSYGRLAVDFLLGYVDDEGLPRASYDLWEERRGLHFFTVCAVVAAFEACGEAFTMPSLTQAAHRMKEAAERRFYSDKLGRYLRMDQDETLDSAILGGLLLCPDWQFARQSVDAISSQLQVHSDVGGLARYDTDYYFRRSERFPGNPWVISTLWLARHQARRGHRTEAIKWLEWAAERAESTGVLAEQFHPETGEPLSVSPLTWSHAEYVETVLELLEPPSR